MHPPINTKQQMYELLSTGRLGNTIPQFDQYHKWLTAKDGYAYSEWWGVRTKSAGGGGGPCKLNCHRDEVAQTIQEFERAGYRCNLSVMIDRLLRVTLWAEVVELDDGLWVYGIEYPPEGGSWRDGMPYAAWQENRGHWQGIAARMLLRKHLNPNSLDDMHDLLCDYPGHVIEFSACDQCFGTLSHRNTITWEVRGEY